MKGLYMSNFNIQLNNLKNNLVNTINQSGVPVGAVYYLLKDILSEVTDSYKQTLAIEKQVEALTKEDTKNNEN